MNRMKKTTRNYVWLLIANVLLITFIGAFWQFRLKYPAFAVTAPVLQGEFKHIEIQNPARALPSAVYLKDLKVETNIADLKGQWTVLNLWASWCPPCVTEMPSLEKMAQNYAGKGLRVIAMSIDNFDKPNEIEEVVKKLKFGSIARHWDHKGLVSDALGPQSLPITYIIDPQGRLFATYDGAADWMGEDARAFIDSFLAKK